MGHEDDQSTLVYTKPTRADVEEAGKRMIDSVKKVCLLILAVTACLKGNSITLA
jgi:hypothetical protein